MKFGTIKRILSLMVAIAMVTMMFVGCGEQAADDTESKEATSKVTTSQESNTEVEATVEEKSTEVTYKGKLMWLSNLSSGVQFEGMVRYIEAIGDAFGYEIQVVYGDMFNDPAGNLTAVKNSMTDDVVGLIASQDGGIKDIMAEYPELYVAGFNTDMLSVFDPSGVNAEVLDNSNYLGTIADGYYDGTLTGEQFAQEVIDGGYKRVSVMQFPGFAYPNLDAATTAFVDYITAYNGTVATDDQIEIVGATKVLEFQPLEETYFLEEGLNNLDAIVGFCAGAEFVYPTLKAAIANGNTVATTKLLTGGFVGDPAVASDIGGDGVIQFISISPTENIAWTFTMLDGAITNNLYDDYTQAERLHSIPYVLDSIEDVENVYSKGLTGTGIAAKAQVTIEDIMTVAKSTNPDATYADLVALFHSEQLYADALID